jgi:mono/diheme cytochrome c family protein
MKPLPMSLVALAAVAGCDAAEPRQRDVVAVASDEARGGKRGEIEAGRQIFRHDTFGDEALWTDVLGMHTIIATSVDPTTALAVGLKVDAEALPPGILAEADLTDPATTVALLSLGAVVGIEGQVAADGTLERVGVTCALCHSTVDDSVAPGIGRRLDGHPNRDLDPGLILSLSAAFTEEQKADLRSWGPGRYDARWNHDGISAPVLIPPAYGLAHVPVETYTGDGPVSYWNAYVAVTQMGGQGVFIDPRIGVEVVREPDIVTPKLPALLAYQLSLKAPRPADGSYDAEAAARGKVVFDGRGRCASCHEGAAFTDAGSALHTPEEVGQEPLHARRSATGAYRTTPLRGAWAHPPYFHDGSVATLEDVVEHYDGHMALGLTDAEKADLVVFVSSL